MSKLFNPKKTKSSFRDDYLIRKEVNKFDKSFNLDLKNPEVWAMPELYLAEYTNSADRFIKATICVLNGLDPREWMDVNNKKLYGITKKSINSNPGESSRLHWSDKKTKYPVESIVFKCRFLTVLLMELCGKIDDATRRHVGKKKKYEERILSTKTVVNSITNYVKQLLYTKSYTDININNIVYVTLMAFIKKTRAHELYKNYRLCVNNLSEYLKLDILHGRYHSSDDDIIIYEILKIAYLLVTFDDEFKNLPAFDGIEGATIQYDMRMLVQALGISLIKQSGGNSLNYSPLFRAFTDAHPIITSKYASEINEDVALKTGIYALNFVDWFMHNKKTHSFIHNLLKPGV